MGYFLSNDKLPLYWESVTVTEPNATIVFVHGLGEHIGRYRAVFEDFAHRGYSCFGFDQRGFGQSHGERGHIAAFSQYLDDLHVFIGQVSTQSPGQPLYLFGHSMGAIVVLSYALANRSSIQGLLVFSCPIRQAQWLGRTLGPMLGPLSLFLPRLRIPNMIDSGELTNDPAVVQAFNNDGLVEKQVSLKWLSEFNRACGHLLANARQITIPTVIAHGACDRIADVAGAKWLFGQLGSEYKTLLVYDGLKHELLNHKETDRRKVLEDTFQWLDESVNKTTL